MQKLALVRYCIIVNLHTYDKLRYVLTIEKENIMLQIAREM